MVAIMRMMMVVVLVWMLGIMPAWASYTQWKVRDEVRTRLLVGNAEETGMIRYAGINMQLAKNWHTYWRTPGDGGLAPSIDWSGSKNVKNIELQYPAPHRSSKTFEGYDPIETYAYSNEVVLPLKITLEHPQRTTELQLRINYGVCDELCIFLDDTFDTRIPYNHVDDYVAKVIDDYRDRVPKENGSNGLIIENITLVNNDILEVKAISDMDFASPDIFIEQSENFKFPQPEVILQGDKALFRFHYKTLLDGATIFGKQATLTLVNGDHAVEHTVTLPSSPGQALSIAGGAGQAFLWIVLAAFLGGLILNIMPCVLPVLSLKLLGIAKHGGGNHRQVRAAFLESAAGILVSFLVLAGIVIALKAGGAAVGWGFHFQQPLFVIALVILINMFAANQWSLFEIQLPSWLGGRIQQALPEADDHTPMGHFMTGVFATLLATPCSAPYLGTAVGFALSQGSTQILLVFFVMGLGLAFPYLLVAVMPKLVTKLPRPGIWMVRVKHVMGLLLLFASAWLLWVLSNQMGWMAAAAVAVLSVGSILLLWLYKHQNIPASKGALIMVIIVGLSITFTVPFVLKDIERSPMHQQEFWQVFDEAEIDSLVAQGKVVFVDVTADWCLTCKFNKLHVLSDSSIADMLMAEDVVAMQADYTNPSEAITQFLKRHNRYGIPFNIVYGPGAPGGIPLSELLSKEAVSEALQNARK